jgi:hypothetical protein
MKLHDLITLISRLPTVAIIPSADRIGVSYTALATDPLDAEPACTTPPDG